MGPLCARCGLEWLLGLYLRPHVPITLLLDLQVVLPCKLYPIEFRNLFTWHPKDFKDPLLQMPPTWFKPFSQALFQLPCFPSVACAFVKGGCKWTSTPAIFYSVHTVTILIPVLSIFLSEDFSKANGFKGPGPQTFRVWLILISIYAPYFFIPGMLLLFMLWSLYYKYEMKEKNEKNNHGPRGEMPRRQFPLRSSTRKTAQSPCLQQHLKHTSSKTLAAASSNCHLPKSAGTNRLIIWDWQRDAG